MKSTAVETSKYQPQLNRYECWQVTWAPLCLATFRIWSLFK